jgi:hypothetical protein
MMAEPSSGSNNGFTTKDFLVRLDSKMDGIDKKVDESLLNQARMQQTLLDGRYAERLTTLETFKNKTEGGLTLVKWAAGSSGIAIFLGLASLYLSLQGG